jgi:hypothetical protein
VPNNQNWYISGIFWNLSYGHPWMDGWMDGPIPKIISKIIISFSNLANVFHFVF